MEAPPSNCRLLSRSPSEEWKQQKARLARLARHWRWQRKQQQQEALTPQTARSDLLLAKPGDKNAGWGESVELFLA